MKIKNIILLFSSLLIMTSCTKVIDLSLPDSEAKLVIEAEIGNIPASNKVRLSKTVNYNEANFFPPVSGAVVIISDNVGNADTLTEAVQGIYQSSKIMGVEGRTYYLTVTAENKTYTAECKMPYQVPFDSLIFGRLQEFGSTDSFDVVTPVYTDPVGLGNGYRFVRYINNVRYKGSWFADDQFTDGETNNFTFDEPDMILIPGDTLAVEMQSIDKVVYQYFYSKDQTTSNSTGAPANPVTNIKGGALGFFSAYTSQTRKVVVY